LSIAVFSVSTAGMAGASPSRLGRAYQGWLQEVGQYFLGDPSNPLIAGLEGDCGDLRDGVFFLAAPIDVGQEFDCEIPVGTWIVLSHAGVFTTEGLDADTDAELEALALTAFTTLVDTLSLDGRPLPLRTISTGAYDVISASGSFYDTVIGVGTGSIRTVVVGNVTLIHPLSPGVHVIDAEVLFKNGDHYSATYRLHVS
jgi:hypothetical protein